MTSATWPKTVSAVALIVLSLLIVFSASQLEFYSMVGPGPGLFPLVLGAILCLLSILWLVLPQRGDEDEESLSKASIIRVGSVIALVSFSILSMDLLGFTITAFLVVATGMRLLGKNGPLLTFCLAAATSLGSFYVFQVLLGVSLPASSIPFLSAIGV